MTQNETALWINLTPRIPVNRKRYISRHPGACICPSIQAVLLCMYCVGRERVNFTGLGSTEASRAAALLEILEAGLPKMRRRGLDSEPAPIDGLRLSELFGFAQTDTETLELQIQRQAG